jgi:hypothetical protein
LDINWKVLAIFGGFGFIISLLVGAISGVGFGTLLFRGILSGVLFAGVGFGLSILIKKFLPGLVSETEEAEEEEESGGVDIVIEEEAPQASSVAAAEAAGGEELFSDTPTQESGPAEEEEESENFIEEVEEISGDSSEQEEVAEGSSEPEDLIEVDADTSVDTLPDIGDFSDSFTNEIAEEGSEGGESQMQSVDSSPTIDLNGREEDPRTVAKAVQSMLKKE